MSPEFKKALLELRSKISNPKRNKKAHQYNYADLTEVFNCVRDQCEELGFLIIEQSGIEEDHSYLNTHLIHIEHEGRISTTRCYKDSEIKGNYFQGCGSAATYFRRYNLLEIFNLAPEDDDAQSLNKQTVIPENKGDYVIKFGKFKGQKISDVTPGDHVNYISFIEKKASDDKKPITGVVKEYIDIIRSM